MDGALMRSLCPLQDPKLTCVATRQCQDTDPKVKVAVNQPTMLLFALTGGARQSFGHSSSAASWRFCVTWPIRYSEMF